MSGNSHRRGPAPRQVVSSPITRGGVGAGKLPARLVQAISATDRQGATPPGVAGLNRVAYLGCNTSTGDDSNSITVLIASGREGLLKELLPRLAGEQDIKVPGEPVQNPALLLTCVEQCQPKLLLLDRTLLDQLGSESLRMIRTKVRGTHVLLLWNEVSVGLVEEILRSRFHGFLLNGCPLDTYVKAIRAVSRGDIWVPRGLLAQALSDLLHTPSPGDAKAESNRIRAYTADMLTKREEQIVAYLRQGYTNKQIAQQLDIMEDTVKKHLQHVFGKLGVRRRALVVLRQFTE